MDTKRIAFLTAGPSLWRDWSEELFESYELVFAVNMAGASFRCHYWGMVDDHMIGIIKGGARLPEMGFFSNKVFQRERTTFALGLYGQDAEKLNDSGIDSMQTSNCHWTMPCLLKEAGLVADSLGTILDIYGLDCSLELGTRWKMELPWVRYAMPKNIGLIYGEIDPSWREWIQQGWEDAESLVGTEEEAANEHV